MRHTFFLTSPMFWLYWQHSRFASLILKYWQLSHCKIFRKTAIPSILFLIFLLLPGLHTATKLLLAICKHMWRYGVCMTQGHVQGSTVLLTPPAESILTSSIKILGLFLCSDFFRTLTFGFSAKRKPQRNFG